MIPFDAVIVILAVTFSSIGLYFLASGLIDSIFNGDYTKSFFGALLMLGSMLALYYLIP